MAPHKVSKVNDCIYSGLYFKNCLNFLFDTERKFSLNCLVFAQYRMIIDEIAEDVIKKRMRSKKFTLQRAPSDIVFTKNREQNPKDNASDISIQ